MENNEAKNLKLQKAIVRAIVFFDMFDYPLSANEIVSYLDCPATFLEASKALENLPDNIQEKQGFYFLSGREGLLTERPKRFNFTAQKFKIAKRVTKVFRLVPYIELLAVSNIIGSHNLRDQSDIDLFIITRPKRIWLTRLICAGLMKILNLRPNKKTKRNKICLSFYITTEQLNLEKLKISDNDWYFNYWLAGLVPLYDRGGVYEKLIKQNSWLERFLPNWRPYGPVGSREIKVRKCLSKFKMFGGRIMDRMEMVAKKWQLRILPPELKELMNQDTRVIISDSIIKLYLVDRRAELSEKYQTRIKNLL
jgi:hypothetical protein